MHLRLPYREPFYDALGLQDFIKKYEAHNQYIQIWANSGAIGLMIYLFWLLKLWRFGRFLDPLWRHGWKGLLIAFMLGSIVQNAYSDSEVRHLLMIAIIFAGIISRKEQSESKAPVA